MRIECDTEEQLKELKEKALKCKVIALHNKGKHPLYNPRNMRDKDKKKLTEDIEVLFRKDIREINILFNEIACDELFTEGKDITSYPVYDLEQMKLVREDPPSVGGSSPEYEGDTNSPVL